MLFLIIGAKCGGSDFTSGIAGNAVIGKFFENLTAAGGTVFTTLCEGWFDTFFDVKSKKLTSNFSFAKSIP